MAALSITRACQVRPGFRGTATQGRRVAVACSRSRAGNEVALHVHGHVHLVLAPGFLGRSVQSEPRDERVLILNAQPGAALALRSGRHVVRTMDPLAEIEVERLVQVAVERVVHSDRKLAAVVPATVVERRIEAERLGAVLIAGLESRRPRRGGEHEREFRATYDEHDLAGAIDEYPTFRF